LSPPSLPSVATAISPTEVGAGGWMTMLVAGRFSIGRFSIG
jgi:hypothetical protein